MKAKEKYIIKVTTKAIISANTFFIFFISSLAISIFSTSIIISLLILLLIKLNKT